MRLYQIESSDPKCNAQRNLCGRTHYVDDDTLRWHKSRVMLTRVIDGGLLFAIVTSDALDMNNTKRGFRYVIFDIFGTVLDRPKLENAFHTSDKATKAMWTAANAINAKAATLAAIERQAASYAKEMAELAQQVAAMGVERAA